MALRYDIVANSATQPMLKPFGFIIFCCQFEGPHPTNCPKVTNSIVLLCWGAH